MLQAPGTPVCAHRAESVVALPLLRAWQLLYWLIYLRGCVWICLSAATAASTYCQGRGKPSEEGNRRSPEREVSHLPEELTAASLPPDTHGVWW